MAQHPATHHAPSLPPAPIYLSPISHVLLGHMYATSGHIDLRTWTKRDRAFINAYPALEIYDDQSQPKIIPNAFDGIKMANRYRARTHERATEMAGFINIFKVPYSRLRRIHGPSKLRLEITESEPSGAVDFTPIRTHPFMRACLEKKEMGLCRYSRGQLKGFVQPMPDGDPRSKVRIPLENDEGFWEGLFGEYKMVKEKLSDEEKMLERRGCLWNGKIVGVVDDDIFPGWGEDWALEDVTVNGSVEDPAGREGASTASADVEAMDTGPYIEALGMKRSREDDDQEDVAETPAKKSRIV
ncbi:hypothetical protein PENSPDRAFT_749691 [Peniophora sp. CONT]|nr:hypothetical protein PENSPDRAFT_749691 [Peniophora sp. CONT]